MIGFVRSGQGLASTRTLFAAPGAGYNPLTVDEEVAGTLVSGELPQAAVAGQVVSGWSVGGGWSQRRTCKMAWGVPLVSL